MQNYNTLNQICAFPAHISRKLPRYSCFTLAFRPITVPVQTYQLSRIRPFHNRRPFNNISRLTQSHLDVLPTMMSQNRPYRLLKIRRSIWRGMKPTETYNIRLCGHVKQQEWAVVHRSERCCQQRGASWAIRRSTRKVRHKQGRCDLTRS